MKKNLFLILLLVINVFVSSCGKDELKYSCDENINQYVKDNLEEFSVLSRSAWLKVSPELKKPLYRTFSSAQKSQFWKNKYSELIKLNWSNDGLSHINKIYALIDKKDFFNKKTSQDEIDKLQIFYYKWSEYAKEYLNWNNKIIYSIVATGEQVINTKGDLMEYKTTLNNTSTIITRSESGFNDCACSQLNDWCDPTGEFRTYCSPKTGCTSTEGGCGWFGTFSCTGACRGLGTGD